MVKKIPLAFAFICLINLSLVKAQHITHDIGVFGGVSIIQTDFGERGDFKNSLGDRNLSLSIAHYMHFFNRDFRWNSRSKFSDKIAIKTELNFIPKSTFNHYGNEAEDNDLGGEKLRAMTAEISMVNLGVSLEYYFSNLRNFIHPYSDKFFCPYITFGIRYALYNNKIQSTFGARYDSNSDGNTPTAGVLIDKYYQTNALKTGSNSALGFTLGVGARYNITEKLDLSSQINWQVFLSDTIDGLQVKEPSNKNNEWLFNFQIGIIYHLNFTEPLF